MNTTRALAAAPPRLIGLLRDHLRNPLYTSVYNLTLNTLVSSLLGVGYWAIAARLFTPRQLGAGAAVVTTMTFLSSLAQLNLNGAVVRFLPAAGRDGARLIRYVYGASCAAAVVLGAGFLTLAPANLREVGVLGAGPLMLVAFTVSVAAWGIFTLQDSVLTALHGTKWIPIENTLFGVVKMALLIALATSVPSAAIFLSWNVPVLLVLLPINVLVFRRLLPRLRLRASDLPPRRSLFRFVSLDYLGYLFLQATTNGMPLLVTAILGASANAVFYVGWLLGTSAEMVAYHFGTSLTVESAADKDGLSGYTRDVLRRALPLLVSAALGLCLVAPYVLALFGGGYASASGWVLRLVALAVIPKFLVSVFVATARVRQRAGLIVAVHGCSGLAVVSLSVLLTRHFGLGVTGIGAAYLGGQSIVAAAVLPALVRLVRGSARVGTRGGGWLGRRRPLAALRRAGGRGGRAAASAGLALSTLVALVVGVLALRSVRLDSIGSLGLVQALPPALYAALALLTATFVTTVYRSREGGGGRDRFHRLVLVSHVVVFAVLLHGAASIVEPVPRFTPAWLHVGFADYIARTGRTLPELDARFSWPGFFALAAMSTRLAGLRNALPLLGYVPVLFNLLYALAVHRVARATRLGERSAWLAAWLFLPLNWVGQDYFSPQGVNSLFYLVIMLALLSWLRVRPAASRLPEPAGRRPAAVLRLPAAAPRPGTEGRAGPRVAAGASPHASGRAGAGAGRCGPFGWSFRSYLLGRFAQRRRAVAARGRRPRALRLVGLPAGPMALEAGPVAAGPATRAGVLALLLLLFVASTISHQLTPVAIMASAFTLVIVRRCSVRALPVLFLVVFTGYISYMTVSFWAGHLSDLFGSFGDLGGTVSAGVSERVRGDPGHLAVVQARQWFVVAVCALAAAGAWRRLRRREGDLAFLALTAAPLLLIFAQSYGGEVVLRVYAFVSPFAAILLAALLLPTWPVPRRAVAAVLAATLSAVATGAFFVARYGNEDFERMRAGDAAAVTWLYAHARPGATFVTLASNLPWRYQDVERYYYKPLGSDLGPQSLLAIEEAVSKAPGESYLIFTPGEQAMLSTYYGRPDSWTASIERQVVDSGRFQLVYSRDGAEIFIFGTGGRSGANERVR